MVFLSYFAFNWYLLNYFLPNTHLPEKQLQCCLKELFLSEHYTLSKRKIAVPRCVTSCVSPSIPAGRRATFLQENLLPPD